jgi:hypothetical protein
MFSSSLRAGIKTEILGWASPLSFISSAGGGRNWVRLTTYITTGKRAHIKQKVAQVIILLSILQQDGTEAIGRSCPSEWNLRTV